MKNEIVEKCIENEYFEEEKSILLSEGFAYMEPDSFIVFLTQIIRFDMHEYIELYHTPGGWTSCFIKLKHHKNKLRICTYDITQEELNQCYSIAKKLKQK